jgi:hypothetical protein
MEKKDFMHIDVQIVDSDFDTSKDHQVQLGPDTSVPAFFSKNISTDIVAKSKQVIALGGRLHTQQIKSEDKIPWLGDIPYLGTLFRSTSNSTIQNDLIFFLVPEIVDANEDINDTKFYKNFKNEGIAFHKEVLDENSTAEKNSTSDSNITQALSDGNAKKQQEYVFDIDDKKSNFSTTTLPEVSKEAIMQKDVEIKSTNEQATNNNLKKYEVITKNIFLRDAPSNGGKVVVWAQGHTFIAKDEENHDGLTWLKVENDCSKDCVALTSPLWISKKYTKEL